MLKPPVTPFQFPADGDFAFIVEAQHAAIYPDGCPLMCEACTHRLGGTRCGACGRVKPAGQSCLCVDNGCQ